MVKQNGFHIIIEEWPDGYIAYPIGVKGVVVAEGDSYVEAVAGIRSAIQFHIETFGDPDAMEAFIGEVAGERGKDR